MPGWPSVGILVTCLKAGVAQHLHGQFAAFVHAAILGGDRGLADPGLQALHGLVVTLLDFIEHGLKVGFSAKQKDVKWKEMWRLRRYPARNVVDSWRERVA